MKRTAIDLRLLEPYGDLLLFTHEQPALPCAFYLFIGLLLIFQKSTLAVSRHPVGGRAPGALRIGETGLESTLTDQEAATVNG